MAAGSGSAGTYDSTPRYEDARIHAAAVYCSDGRIGEQMDDFLHRGLGLPRYDRVAVPGGPVCLAGRLMAFWEARGVEDQMRFLIAAHGVQRVVLIMHEPCAYYLDRLGLTPEKAAEAQLFDLARAADRVSSLGEVSVDTFQARVVGGVVRFEPVVFASSARARR